MADEPADLHTNIANVFTEARLEAEKQKAARTDAASRREDAFKARVEAAALKAATGLAPGIARGDPHGHVHLVSHEDEAFYRAVAEPLRPYDVHVSKLLLATNGETLQGLKAKSDWDGTQLNYSYFAHFGSAEAIIQHMQGYDPRDEGEVIQTY